MIGKIITSIILLIFFIGLLYESFVSIRNNDNKMAVICSSGAGLCGLLLGFILGSLLF